MAQGTSARQPEPDGLSARDRAFHRGLAAARAFRAREGHLDVPQRHVEDLDAEPVRLGQWISNIRRRWDHLTSDRRRPSRTSARGAQRTTATEVAVRKSGDYTRRKIV
ncbi:helicase associated domain-containing protein [Streptomyces sp. NPDC059757]|uniref:helicase associated domain-containing protein n=1 Tax=unclassified Streptomyces TaxID=2593676 RepID=UPI003668F91E